MIKHFISKEEAEWLDKKFFFSSAIMQMLQDRHDDENNDHDGARTLLLTMRTILLSSRNAYIMHFTIHSVIIIMFHGIF